MRRTCVLLTLLLCAFSTRLLAQKQIFIDFEQFSQSAPHDVQPAAPLTVDKVTITGGQLVTHALNDTINGTTIYWTADYEPDHGETTDATGLRWGVIQMNFSQSVSNVAFKLMSGMPAGDPNYYVDDDQGHTLPFVVSNLCSVPPCVGIPGAPNPGIVRWPYSSVRMLRVRNRSLSGWNFSIDDLSYTRPADRTFRIAAGLTDDTTFAYKIASINQITATFPLGARIRLQLQVLQSDGTWAASPATYTSGANVVGQYVQTPYGQQYAPLNNNALFPLFVVFPYAASASPVNHQDYQAVHIGDAYFALVPADDVSLKFVVKLTINEPQQVGPNVPASSLGIRSNDNRWDWAITKYAHESGIPPQYVKQQILQESDAATGVFDPNAWLYEMQARDYNVLQQYSTVAAQWHHSDWWSSYALDDGRFLCPAPLITTTGASCTNGQVDDISPRTRQGLRGSLTIMRDGVQRAINAGEVGVTARMIWDGCGSRFSRLWWPNSSPPVIARHRVAGSIGITDPLGFIAQTPEASSYGFMQMVWTDVLDKMNWGGANGHFNPALLFDSTDGLSHGYSSLRVGTQFLTSRFRTRNLGNLADKPSFASVTALDSAMYNAWEGYNGGGYAGDVARWNDVYYPHTPKTPVFAQCSAPAITAITGPVVIRTGNTVLLTASATTDPTTAYQWFEGNAGDTSRPVSGGNAPTLQVTATASTAYWAQASSECGSAASPPVRVTVVPSCALPLLASMSADATVSRGTPVDLTVITDAANTVQWFAGNAPTAVNAPNTGNVGYGPTLRITPQMTAAYYALVSNTCGSVLSKSVTVTVTCDAPRITAQPVSTTTNAGTATLLVGAEGTGPLSYQWYEGAAGDTSHPVANTYVIVVTPAATTTYWVRVTNTCGSLNSVTATVSVPGCQPPTPSITPGDPTTSGGNVTLVANATGDQPVTYQWYHGTIGDTSQPLTSGASLPVAPATTTAYWVLATNSCGTGRAQVTVTVIPCAVPEPSIAPLDPTTSGETVTLTATATGDQPITLQWYQGTIGNTAQPLGAGTTLSVAPTSTTSYWVLATNACGAGSAQMTVTVTMCTPPVITQAPASTSVATGVSAPLAVGAGGTQPLSYQWYTGNTGDTTNPVAGAITSTISVSPASTTSYWVRVTNNCGHADSSAAIVTITPSCTAPTITTQPQDQSISSGGTATLSLAADGSTPFSYQWYTGSTGDRTQPVPNASNPTITVAPTTTASYWAEVGNMCGTAASTTATVTVATCTPIQITQQPRSTSTTGSSVPLSVGYTGTTPVSIQWYTGVSGNTTNRIPGATGATMTVQPTTTTSYWAQLTNACSTVNTASATVTVLPACTPVAIPVSGEPAQSTTITQGESVTLTVTPTGTMPYSYGWYVGQAPDTGQPIGSAAGPSLTVTPTATESYWALVRNSCGTATSWTATVTVLAAQPQVINQPTDASVATGTTATLAFTVTGMAPLQTQWYQGTSGDETTPLPNATTTTLTIQPAGTAVYWAKTTNAHGTAKTNTVTITVTPTCTTPAVTLTAQPPDPDGRTVLTTQSTGSAPFTYQWYEGALGDTSRPITNSSSTTVTPTTTTHYWVRVKNACATASAATVVSVPCTTPVLTQQPVARHIAGNGTAQLSVTATDATNYQWYAGSSGDVSHPATGGTNDTLLVRTPGPYWVAATNSCGTSNSDTATITAQPPGRAPQVVPPPADVIAAARKHGSVDVTWSATTNGSFEVWRANGGAFAPVASTNAREFHDHGLTPRQSYAYVIIAVDADGNMSGPSIVATTNAQ